MRLLIVEDEKRLATTLAKGLAAEGFAVDVAHDGREGLHRATTQGYDLLILDIMLPGMNGYRLCATLRAAGDETPILMLTAKDGEYDEAEGAELVRDELAHRSGDRLPITAALPDGPCPVSASRTQLARVLGNLVGNAQRHAGSAVRVAVRQEAAGTVALDVTDDGPGVPPADRERVFTRFIRLDDARSRDEGGAGLGLAIVRDVVHRHGGRIEVGDADGGGARFTVTLPNASD